MRHPLVRERIEREEEERLSPLAQRAARSRGRPRPEPLDTVRTAFQRDRDRIIHSKAFRRLKHKTQVFIAPTGDHYRTRLTHTLEVAQIGRTLARALRLNEDLVEAICLAHDLGHAPFGHAGEEALREVFDAGYRHNDQSLRIVDYLARDGAGLNLSQEVREALPNSTPVQEGMGGEGRGHGSLETKIQKLSDSIAYINHDIDDAMRAGLIAEADLPPTAVTVLGQTHSERINTLVTDLIERNWDVAYPPDPAVDPYKVELLLSPAIEQAADQLRSYLYDQVYTNARAKSDNARVHSLIHALFAYFCDHFYEMPEELTRNPRAEAPQRIVADYVAGMTDHYAIETFQRIYVPRLWST